nr:GFA family protein [uncultured Rhodopila sp.]
MPEIAGHCRCGKVSYRSSAEPAFVGICHCRTCQISTGSAFATVVGLPADSLSVSGTTKQFDDIADSGKPTHRAFCPECGSTITQWVDAMPGIIMVPAGTLNDPAGVKPAMQLYCDSALPWATIGGDVQSFPKMPG